MLICYVKEHQKVFSVCCDSKANRSVSVHSHCRGCFCIVTTYDESRSVPILLNAKGGGKHQHLKYSQLLSKKKKKNSLAGTKKMFIHADQLFYIPTHVLTCKFATLDLKFWVNFLAWDTFSVLHWRNVSFSLWNA